MLTLVFAALGAALPWCDGVCVTRHGGMPAQAQVTLRLFVESSRVLALDVSHEAGAVRVEALALVTGGADASRERAVYIAEGSGVLALVVGDGIEPEAQGEALAVLDVTHGREALAALP